MPARDLSELRVESWSIVCFVVKISPRLENLLNIIHEDAGLLVINKPAGLVCHPIQGAGFPAEDGSAYGNRTRLSALRGPCPNR